MFGLKDALYITFHSRKFQEGVLVSDSNIITNLYLCFNILCTGRCNLKQKLLTLILICIRVIDVHIRTIR